MGWNDDLIADFRQHGKVTKGPFVGRQLLLLTTKGAKSGKDHTTPVVYTTEGDDLVVVASKGGSPTNPSWYHNLKANPTVTVELPPGDWRDVLGGGAVEGGRRPLAELLERFPVAVLERDLE